MKKIIAASAPPLTLGIQIILFVVAMLGANWVVTKVFDLHERDPYGILNEGYR
jgi:hypothetical protein